MLLLVVVVVVVVAVPHSTVSVTRKIEGKIGYCESIMDLNFPQLSLIVEVYTIISLCFLSSSSVWDGSFGPSRERTGTGTREFCFLSFSLCLMDGTDLGEHDIGHGGGGQSQRLSPWVDWEEGV